MCKSKLVARMKNDCLIRGTAHRNRFSKYRTLHIWIGLPSALLATLAGSLATVNANSADTGFTILEIITLVATWSVALLASANSFLNPHQTSLGHRDKATEYDVRFSEIDRAVAFLEGNELSNKLEEIDRKISELKVSEPILTDKIIKNTEIDIKDKLFSESDVDV